MRIKIVQLVSETRTMFNAYGNMIIRKLCHKLSAISLWGRSPDATEVRTRGYIIIVI